MPVHHYLKDEEVHLVKRFGAAVVIMVMDEIGQVHTVQYINVACGTYRLGCV